MVHESHGLPQNSMDAFRSQGPEFHVGFGPWFVYEMRRTCATAFCNYFRLFCCKHANDMSGRTLSEKEKEKKQEREGESADWRFVPKVSK